MLGGNKSSGILAASCHHACRAYATHVREIGNRPDECLLELLAEKEQTSTCLGLSSTPLSEGFVDIL